MPRILTNKEKWADTFLLFLTSDLCPPTSYPILLGFGFDKIPQKKFIFYNIEQLSRKSCLKELAQYAKNKHCVEIWDYSRANVEICAKHNIKTRHVPPVMSNNALTHFKLLKQVNQSYDIGFAGAQTPRRDFIMNSLEKTGYKINYIFGKYCIERDIEIAKCKILINIHAEEDYQIFESARCEPWLEIGVPIISEHSLDDDPRCINVNYEELIDTSIETLKRLDNILE